MSDPCSCPVWVCKCTVHVLPSDLSQQCKLRLRQCCASTVDPPCNQQARKTVMYDIPDSIKSYIQVGQKYVYSNYFFSFTGIVNDDRELKYRTKKVDFEAVLEN
jgi:hypothetical protein